MPGLKTSSCDFSDKVCDVFVDDSWERHPLNSCIYIHRETNSLFLIHGDDGWIIGDRPHVLRHRTMVEEKLETKDGDHCK